MQREIDTPTSRPAPSGRALQPKISQNLIAFAQPLVVDIPADAPLERFETAYSLAVCAWNTALLQVEGSALEKQELQAILTARYPAELRQQFDNLLARKHRNFADDLRHITTFSVSFSDDGLVVEANSVCTAGRRVPPRVSTHSG